MEKVYAGQIVGEQVKEGDMVVQPCEKKHLTNMRASTSDQAIRLTPARELNIEQAIEWINDDELVEVDARLDPRAQAHARPQPPQGDGKDGRLGRSSLAFVLTLSVAKGKDPNSIAGAAEARDPSRRIRRAPQDDGITATRSP